MLATRPPHQEVRAACKIARGDALALGAQRRLRPTLLTPLTSESSELAPLDGRVFWSTVGSPRWIFQPAIS